jgi:type VI secretion system protein ImpB
MARENTQHKLDRVRSPRVQITYDVEIGDAIELKELPFVMGVLGDLTGQPKNPLAALKERKFVEITPDNFDIVLKNMEPHLAYSVANKLSGTGDGAQLKVDLSFESMDDFAPENIAKKIPPLRDLLELRKRLSDLSGSLQGNDKLDEMLLDAVSNTEMRDKLRKEVESRGVGSELN